jgi:LacI family transcriptional regulator
MAVTLADVAARAGVSLATASRVLNGNYPVAEATRRKVEKAVRDLDYVVNAHARALLHATSGMIGLVLNDISDPFFAAITRGVQSTAETMRRLVVICSSPDEQTEFAYIEMLRRHRADVVIIAGSAPEDNAYRRALAAHARGLSGQGARLVFCDRPTPHRSARAGLVEFDDASGYRAIARHLRDHGHAQIAYLAGPPGWTTTTRRHDGLAAALKECSIPLDHRLVQHGELSRQGGYDATQRLISAGEDFTALCAANDLMAVGALAALRDAGLRVPVDVSVIGFDDVPVAQDVTPALTTVRLPLAEAGSRAVALAFAGRDFADPVRLSVRFVPRDSVADAHPRTQRQTA